MTVVFCGRLVENLRFGHALLIAGKTCEGAESFSITLCSDEHPQSPEKIPTNGLTMHFDLEQDKMILQQLYHNKCCNTESLDCDYFHFLNQFTIYIVIGHKKFDISINENLTAAYKYAINLKNLKLNILDIKGDLEYICQVDHRQYFPCPWPPIQTPERRLHFTNDIPAPFGIGHVMVISAQLKGNEAGCFIMHLRNIWDAERQEMHMSVRFDTQVVIWNSKTTKDDEHFSFDEEERCPCFPFPDFYKPFKLAIGFAKHGLKFAKDGDFLYTFIHRRLNVLPCMGGLKIFGIDGTRVIVNSVDHLRVEDAFCIGFEKLSQL